MTRRAAFRSLSRRAGAVVLLVASILAAPSSSSARDEALPATEERRLTLLVTSGLSGRLVDGDRTIASVVETVRREVAAIEAAGGDVVVFDAGRAFAPYAESRWDGGATMTEALRAAGVSAVVPHLLDVAATRSSGRLPGAGLPLVAGLKTDDVRTDDVRTDGEARPRETVTVQVDDGLAVEIRAVWDAGLVADLDSYGLRAAPLLDDDGAPRALEPTPRTLQVAVVHAKRAGRAGAVGLGTSADRLTWELVQRPRGRDLVIDPDLGQDLALRAVGADDAASPVALVGRRLDTLDPWSIARVELDLVLEGEDVTVRRVELDVLRPDESKDAASDDPELVQLAESALRAVEQFRDANSEPLPADGPQTYPQLVCFALDAMRRAHGAEIAVLDQRSLRPVAPEHFERPTQEAVQRLLPIDQWLVVRTLTGEQILELAETTLEVDRGLADFTLDDACAAVDRDGPRRFDSDALLFRGVRLTEPLDPIDRPGAGVDLEADDLEINGRALYLDDRYTVVTSRFLSQGGHGYSLLASTSEDTDFGDDEPLELRARVLDELSGLPDLVDPRDRPLWRFGVERLALDFTGVDLDADPAYETSGDSRARVHSSSSLLGALHLFADRERPTLRWENRLTARFGLIDTEGGSESELADDLRAEISAVFTEADWLGGNPFLAYVFDSELRRDRVGATDRRLPRQHEQNLVVGLDWEAESWPRLRLGLVAQRQDDVEDAERWGVLGEAVFARGDDDALLRYDARLLAEALEDVDIDASQTRVTLDLRLLVRLRDRLDLAPGIELYRFEDSRLPGAADYRRVSLGLSWSWIGKRQR